MLGKKRKKPTDISLCCPGGCSALSLPLSLSFALYVLHLAYMAEWKHNPRQFKHSVNEGQQRVRGWQCPADGTTGLRTLDRLPLCWWHSSSSVSHARPVQAQLLELNETPHTKARLFFRRDGSQNPLLSKSECSAEIIRQAGGKWELTLTSKFATPACPRPCKPLLPFLAKQQPLRGNGKALISKR